MGEEKIRQRFENLNVGNPAGRERDRRGYPAWPATFVRF